MNTAMSTATFSDETLLDLQLRVARRADQLSPKTGCDRQRDRRIWLRAEFEVFERAESARPQAILAWSVPARPCVPLA